MCTDPFRAPLPSKPVPLMEPKLCRQVQPRQPALKPQEKPKERLSGPKTGLVTKSMSSECDPDYIARDKESSARGQARTNRLFGAENAAIETDRQQTLDLGILSHMYTDSTPSFVAYGCSSFPSSTAPPLTMQSNVPHTRKHDINRFTALEHEAEAQKAEKLRLTTFRAGLSPKFCSYPFGTPPLLTQTSNGQPNKRKLNEITHAKNAQEGIGEKFRASGDSLEVVNQETYLSTLVHTSVQSAAHTRALSSGSASSSAFSSSPFNSQSPGVQTSNNLPIFPDKTSSVGTQEVTTQEPHTLSDDFFDLEQIYQYLRNEGPNNPAQKSQASNFQDDAFPPMTPTELFEFSSLYENPEDESGTSEQLTQAKEDTAAASEDLTNVCRRALDPSCNDNLVGTREDGPGPVADVAVSNHAEQGNHSIDLDLDADLNVHLDTPGFNMTQFNWDDFERMNAGDPWCNGEWMREVNDTTAAAGAAADER